MGRTLSQDRGIPFFDDCATEIEAWDAAVLCLQSDQDCIMADPGFCIDRVKKKLLAQIADVTDKAVIDFIYFANEPEICANNVSVRADGRAVSKRFTRDLSIWYTVPDGVITIPCYKDK